MMRALIVLTTVIGLLPAGHAFLASPPLGHVRLHRIPARTAGCSGMMMAQQGIGAERRGVLRDWMAIGATTLLPAFFHPMAAVGADDLEEYKEELGSSSGKAVEFSFSYPKSWKVERRPGEVLVTDTKRDACSADPDRCDFGEIFMRSVPTGDNALVGVITSPSNVKDLEFSFFKKAFFTRGGKFGAYGAPEDIKVVSDKMDGPKRVIDVKWNTFTPGGSTLAKRSVITATNTGPEVYMVIATSSGTRWKNAEPFLRATATSLQVLQTERAAPKAETGGLRKSMFINENAERARLERERQKEGIY